MQIQKGDILIALKAINLTPGIGNRDRAVAAALLDHFNRKTGQCDPSIKRLSALLAISERTTFRSLNRIEADRLFLRIRHGGHLNRNSYAPNWERFREIEAVWSARMKSRPATTTDLSPLSGQGCQLVADKDVAQTCRINLSKETCSSGLPTEARRECSIPGRTPQATAARTEAERRWSTALLKYFVGQPVSYSEAVTAFHEQMAATATDAEMQQRGAGLDYLLRQLGIPI